MIFSSDTEKLLQELQEFLPFVSSYKPERVIPLLHDTERIFLTPVLGRELYNRLLEQIDTHEEEIRMCRKAIANIMVYMNFTVLNTQILPGGFSRLGGEGTTPLYKYQEEDLKKTFRRNGFDELDLIVSHFMSKIENFLEFKKSEYYISGRGEIIPNRFVFSKYYKNISHIVFKHLQPFIQRAIILDVSTLVNLDELKENIFSENEDSKILNLVRPIVVSLAVAYSIEDMGVNIGETGIWIENIVAGDGLIEKNNLYADQSDALVLKYRKLGSRYMDELTKYLSGSTERLDPHARDNSNKKTIWLS